MDSNARGIAHNIAIPDVRLLALLLMVAAIVLPVSAATVSEIQGAIADRLREKEVAEQSAFTRALTQPIFLRSVYAVENFAPLWTDSGRVKRFLKLISSADRDGLIADDYHFLQLNRRITSTDPSASAIAELDILLTDAFARFAYNLRFGKANPHDIDENWNFSRALITDDPARWLYRAIAEDDIAGALEWLRPKMPVYRTLQAELAHYRQLFETANWPILPDGPTLKPGARDPRVALLRRRLADIASERTLDPLIGSYFDANLEKAVRDFQQRHGLFVDGFVGKATRSQLNVSADTRIDQLRVNLERIRWVFRDIEEEFLAINIAAFHAAYIRGGDIVWQARAVVGRPYRQTPVFKATMTHLIFNPTWTVPPTILKNDVLPGMRKDPAYLQRKGLRVLNYAGVEVDPQTIDWQRAGAERFPYLLRQDPGPQNALGRVKFIFPNSHLVYLHDTPSRDLFKRAERTFSSGCIRIERPLEFAQILLNTNDDPTPLQVQDLVAGKSPRRIDLKHPLTVMLLYLTAFTAEDGTLQFRRDIYNRDQAVLQALNGPFKFTPPKGYSKT